MIVREAMWMEGSGSSLALAGDDREDSRGGGWGEVCLGLYSRDSRVTQETQGTEAKHQVASWGLSRNVKQNQMPPFQEYLPFYDMGLANSQPTLRCHLHSL